MGKTQREKGKRGERELAGLLPAVFHRRDRCGWLVTMQLSDWIKIYREWEAGRNER